jgi:hypothetical protein
LSKIWVWNSTSRNFWSWLSPDPRPEAQYPTVRSRFRLTSELVQPVVVYSMFRHSAQQSGSHRHYTSHASASAFVETEPSLLIMGRLPGYTDSSFSENTSRGTFLHFLHDGRS